MKRCGGCKQDLAVECFYRASKSGDGLQSRCMECQKTSLRLRVAAKRLATVASLSDPTGKLCPRCREVLPWDRFHKNRSNGDERQAYCKDCSNEIRREYEHRNAEVIALRRAERLARQPAEGATKECRKCGTTKPMLSFYAHRTTKDSRANYCMECQKAASRQWSRDNADKVKATNDAHRLANPEKRKRDHRQYWLKLYGLDQAQYEALLAEQGGTCAICERPERYVDKRTGELRKLSVDHDHKTNLVRGLLCGHCNRGIGQFDDNPLVLARASTYLSRGIALG